MHTLLAVRRYNNIRSTQQCDRPRVCIFPSSCIDEINCSIILAVNDMHWQYNCHLLGLCENWKHTGISVLTNNNYVTPLGRRVFYPGHYYVLCCCYIHASINILL